MNAKGCVWSSDEDSYENNVEGSIYALVSQLSKHVLRAHRSCSTRNAPVAYRDDTKAIRRLRTKAFEILLKKNGGSTSFPDGNEFQETDPYVEMQKYAFALKLESKFSHVANTMENLLENLREDSCGDVPVSSVLQLLIQLKSSKIEPEPITNIFYCGKTNPAAPAIARATTRVPPFPVFPIECFLSSDKFEATLTSQWFEITSGTAENIGRETNLLYDSTRTKDKMLRIGAIDASTARAFVSNQAFEKASSQSLLCPTLYSELDLCILQNNTTDDESENVHVIVPGETVATNCLCLPLVHTNADSEYEGVLNTWKCIDESVTNESNDGSVDIRNGMEWCEKDFIDAVPIVDRRTWEDFGRAQTIRELPFLTETPNAGIHLERIRQTNTMPLLLGKATNSVPAFKEISIKEFVKDAKSMLLGVESDSFEYRQTATGFALRTNITANGLLPESLAETCREAINWGNCFRFLTHLVTAKSTDNKLSQEGLIFKAMCTSVKELLLYYQAALLRIYTFENESERLLKLFEKVRPVATLIVRVANICEPYKGEKTAGRDGSSILTRIYNEAIKVTDAKIALVFYSLLKSCCEVYFRFLQKWIFEGICDDVYGEFMIKTRPLYLRNRSHKFWTKSFSICKDAVPTFLTDLADSILRCGKTVTLLRTCDSKNPVCRVCVTEQPEIKVCLSVTSLHEQSSRCWEYERKGMAALGSVLSLSTAIARKTRPEGEEASEVVPRTEREPTINLSKYPAITGEQEQRVDIGRVSTEESSNQLNVLPSPGESRSASNARLCEKDESVVPARPFFQIAPETERAVTREKSRRFERADVLHHYQSLANDINKRRARSQWRVKRMKMFDKRVDALSAAVRDWRDDQRAMKTRAESGSTTGSASTVPIPISIRDENKNYTDPSYPALLSEAITASRVDASSREETMENRRTEAGYGNRNDNEEYNLRYLESLDAANSLTTERPATLNIIDNARQRSVECKMTPNNNEPDANEIELTIIPSPKVSSVGSVRLLESTSTVSSHDCDNIETPMSCTTDENPASSMGGQSPVSQSGNLDDSPVTDLADLADLATREISRCSRPTSQTSVAVKRAATFSDLFEFAREDASKAKSTGSSLSITDVEVIDHVSLQAYLEKSIRIPLRVQSRLINNAVIKYFLKENNLLSHLHTLRSYFFLLNGEFAKSLTDSLYARLYDISIPIELFNSATLTNLLERALVNSFNSGYVNSELLSLSATDTPAELHISDPTALDCLSLNYKITWPLNIILDETVMQQYGKVFKFLVTSGRVSWVLQEDFSIMKRARNAVATEQYHKVQLYRHSMTQFMNALHNYLTCSVLHASWAEFEKDLEHSVTVDDIYLSHINYIKRILSRCMLNSRGEKVRVCLNNIFKVILKFHNRIRSQSWKSKSTASMYPSFKKLEQMYRAFCELRAYMAHVAFKLATSGYQPHLMHFLNALNMNDSYDLTVKSSRGSSLAPPDTR